MREVNLFPQTKLYLIDKTWQENHSIDSEKLADSNASEQLQRALFLPRMPMWLKQVHGATVVDGDAQKSLLPEADASLTQTPGVVLAIRTADCFSIALYAVSSDTTQAPAIALLHVGWRGAVANLIAEGVTALRKKLLPFAEVSVYAWLGAGIRNYQVDAVVLHSFIEKSKEYQDFFVEDKEKTTHYWLNLPGVLRLQLLNAGVQSIVDSTWCTWQDLSLYSHRRGDKKRLLTLFYLLPPATVDRSF